MLFRFNKDRRGTAVIETAMIIPFLLFLMIIGIEIGMVLNTEINVAGVARSAGRVAAMENSAAAGIAAARLAAEKRHMDLSRLHVTAERHGAVWAVGVFYQHKALVPSIGILMGGEGGQEGDRVIDSVVYYRAEN